MIGKFFISIPRVAGKTLAVALLISLAIDSGCRAPLRGTGVFEILGAPAQAIPAPAADSAVQEETGVRIEYVAAQARGPLATPVYPRAALAAGAGECVVYATLTVDESGKIRDVVPSLTRINLKNRFSGDFFNAARAAVMSWDLTPALYVYYQKGPDGAEKYVRTEAVAVTVEIKFTFEASGKVR